MSLFGGLFNDSSSSSESTKTDVTNTDNRSVADAGATSLSLNGSNNSVFNSVTDGGAMAALNNVLNGAGNVVAASLNTVSDSTSNALGAMGITASSALTGAGNVAAAGLNAASDATSNALAAMGITSNTLMAEASKIVTGQQVANSNDYGLILGAMLKLNEQSQGMLGQNVSLARDLTAGAAGAYQDAASQASGTKSLVLAGLVVVGIAAVMAWGK